MITATDWKNEDLRAGCVQYALQQLGASPSVAAVRSLAVALGLTGEDGCPPPEALGEWLRVERYRPTVDGDVRGHGGARASWGRRDGGTEGWGDEGTEEMERMCVDAPPGALPSPVADPLTALLAEDAEVLSDREKAEIAAALEGEGALVLSRQKRLALAVALRGSDFATRREMVLGLLSLMSGATKEEVSRPAWRVRQTWFCVPDGGRWEYGSVPRLPGQRGEIAESVVTIYYGRVVRAVLLYARVRTQVGSRIAVKQLVPCGVFAQEHVARNCALLQSLVTNSGTTLKDWGALFGQTKAAPSAAAKTMNARINEATGGRGSFRALRGKADPRKGCGKGANAKSQIPNSNGEGVAV